MEPQTPRTQMYSLIFHNYIHVTLYTFYQRWGSYFLKVTHYLLILRSYAKKYFVTVTYYRMEGNFGSGKIWRIHCMNTLAEENLANCEILQVKISWKTYSVKHSER